MSDYVIYNPSVQKHALDWPEIPGNGGETDIFFIHGPQGCKSSQWTMYNKQTINDYGKSSSIFDEYHTELSISYNVTAGFKGLGQTNCTFMPNRN